MKKKIPKAGFIHLIGFPNAGKSTLFNQLIQTPLSIATAKPQTTRQDILGIYNAPQLQAIYMDTPGYLDTPAYLLQERMMQIWKRQSKGSDLLVWVVDGTASLDMPAAVRKRFLHQDKPKAVVLNKKDLLDAAAIAQCVETLRKQLPRDLPVFVVSAYDPASVGVLQAYLHAQLPPHPFYFPTDQLTNRSERFFAAEILRQQLFLHYQDEIPYSAHVEVLQWKAFPAQVAVEAVVFVERKTQQKIIVGKGGEAIKSWSQSSRKALEKWYEKRFFLVTKVRVAANWRKSSKLLDQWGYR